MNPRFRFIHRCIGLFLFGIALVSCTTEPYQKPSGGLIVDVQKSAAIAKHSVRLQVVTTNIIHVSSIPCDKFTYEKSLMVLDTLTPEQESITLEVIL